MAKDKYIEIIHDGETKAGLLKDYVTAKTKDLKEWGYGSITEEEVLNQVNKVLKSEKLSVIGLFIQKDIIIS
jgi:hypothetical protein